MSPHDTPTTDANTAAARAERWREAVHESAHLVVGHVVYGRGGRAQLWRDGTAETRPDCEDWQRSLFGGAIILAAAWAAERLDATEGLFGPMPEEPPEDLPPCPTPAPPPGSADEPRLKLFGVLDASVNPGVRQYWEDAARRAATDFIRANAGGIAFLANRLFVYGHVQIDGDGRFVWETAGPAGTPPATPG